MSIYQRYKKRRSEQDISEEDHGIEQKKEKLDLSEMIQFTHDDFMQNMQIEISKNTELSKKTKSIGVMGNLLSFAYDQIKNGQFKNHFLSKGIYDQMLDVILDPKLKALHIDGSSEKISFEEYLAEYYKDLGVNIKFIKKEVSFEALKKCYHLCTTGERALRDFQKDKKSTLFPEDLRIFSEMINYSNQGYDLDSKIEGQEQTIRESHNYPKTFRHIEITTEDGEVIEVPMFNVLSKRAFVGFYKEEEEATHLPFINVPLETSYNDGHGYGIANIYSAMQHEIDHVLQIILQGKLGQKMAIDERDPSGDEGLPAKAGLELLRNNGMGLNSEYVLSLLKKDFYTKPKHYKYLVGLALLSLRNPDLNGKERNLKRARRENYEDPIPNEVFNSKELMTAINEMLYSERQGRRFNFYDYVNNLSVG